MNNYNCDNCSTSFLEIYTPILLDCGHTFCIVCLKGFLKAEKICMRCSKPIEKSLEEYPTNTKMLEEIAMEKERHFKSTMKSKLKNYEKKCIRRNELLQEIITERTTLKSTINKDIMRLQQLLEKKEKNFDTKEAERLMKELDVNMESVDAVLYCSCTINVKSTIALTDFENVSFYLNELVNRLKNEESFYAYAIVHSKPKYGKITLSTDRINIHALDLTLVDEKSSLVSLQDLKTCVSNDNFSTFIQFLDHTLSFKIIDSSVFALRFIKLCTGEDGPMMKETFSCTFQTGARSHFFYSKELCYVHISKSKQMEGKKKSMIDYDMQIFSKKVTSYLNEPGKVIVRMFQDGHCEIIKRLSNIESITDIVAELIDDEINLPAPEHIEIFDSGISLAL